MANTITKMDSQSALGVYRHTETGFICHDVDSVADIIKANGVLACDMTNGTWAWMAGEDIFVEVYRRGCNSLRNLAAMMLGTKFGAAHCRLSLGIWFNSALVGSSSAGYQMLPGLIRNTVAYGADIRIFGVVTNLQAGRGCSTGLLDDSIANVHPAQAGCTGCADIEGGSMTVPGASQSGGPGIGGSAIVYGKSATVIGRAIIAIPLKSWDLFLSNWRAALPNIDKGEVQTKADAALTRFTTVFADYAFKVPSVRVPVVLMNDGKAYLDNNLTRSHTKASGGQYGVCQYWNLLLSPTLPDANGWWITNPHCGGLNVSHNMLGESITGLGGNFYNTAGVEGNKLSAAYTVAYSEVGSIDGVELMKIMGGFYPRVSTTPVATSGGLITKCFSGNHSDSPLLTQGGGETQAAYEARCGVSQGYPYSKLTGNYGHWNLAGQPAVMASILLDASLQGKTINGQAALSLFSGTLCSLLRCGAGDQNGNWTNADVVANPGAFIRNQYRA